MKRRNEISVAVLGSSATSCMLALYLKKNKFNVTILEKEKNLGGAWSLDRYGPKFSNIISPLNRSEKKFFLKSVNFLKKFKIKFIKNLSKSLYSKKVVDASTSDLEDLFLLAKKKIKIKFKFKVNKIIETNSRVLINGKYSFDYVFFPSYFQINEILYRLENNEKKISTPYNRINTALHVRLFVNGLNKTKYKFNDLTIGPLDRFQIIDINKSTSRINGRVQRAWKTKSRKNIKKEICKSLFFKKLISLKFFKYKSCIRDNAQIKLLERNLNKTRRVKYFETRSILDFVKYNFFKIKLKSKIKGAND